MWAQHWTHIDDILSPFPDLDDTPHIEAELKRRFTALDMIRLAENFYTSLGFPEMTRQFWRKSHFVKRPGEREGSGACQASAFDLYKAGDYRIKMCVKASLSDLKTIHHEMGHINYFMAYSNQPTIYRAPPNAAFHESVGDVAQLSVLSDRSLRALGLMQDDNSTRRQGFQWKSRKKARRLNQLMQLALDKLAFLPFGLVVDRWRWNVFQGNITPDNYNRKWWELRLQYQGIKSPVPRSERDFDPGTKYHIPAHMPFASYFVAYVLEFQLYKALCDASGHVGLLHDCDLYGSKQAGQRLRHILRAGSSKPWQELLKNLTGSIHITADAILEYFRPLEIWLKRFNSYHGQTIGWNDAVVNWEIK
ncbi:angiotensin-converting enzyme [Elysia marginata]|uniref:Angiotensin-converting enzyme n=1 Tax=Elysia marginata TaxID=1093978 RepID=A0AAV4F1L4_9GAST|nr:angiotensin-converting enzyme [Elysia marginata]